MNNIAAFYTYKKLIVNTFPKPCLIYILVGSNENCNITTEWITYRFIILQSARYCKTWNTKLCPQVLQMSKQLILQRIRTLRATDHSGNEIIWFGSYSW